MPAALAVAAAAAACGGAPAEAGCATDTAGWVRCPAATRAAGPAVAGELLDGTRFRLDALRGSVVVVNFWGSWCPPCRAEADDLEQTYRATRADGVAFVGVNIRDERDKARAFETGRASYSSLFDPAGRVALAFEIPPNATPATVVLDRQGRIARVIRKPVQRPTLEPVVREVLAEAG
ncbi:MAG TPA: TlpA disulfide reductase family protein [Pilimelia sp.]|nr:TlpA disulfide reductase family protein [Pilimelia sp.]